MALDVARMVSYGTLCGMRDTAARNHLVLLDGVVGGEGDGPLAPRPVNSGIVLFSDNAPVATMPRRS